jgi:hypothetical protein
MKNCSEQGGEKNHVSSNSRDGQKNMSYMFMCYVLPSYVT